MKSLSSKRKSAFHLGLTGYPLDHSLSPRIHRAGLIACGLDGDFTLFPIPPQDNPGLQRLADRVRRAELTGLSVTLPHKESLFPLLDALSPEARTIGAVNTLCLRESGLTGFNTDAAGFLGDLRRSFPELGPTGQEESSREKIALVLGAGGAARAVVHALLSDGWQVMLAARRLQQADGIRRSVDETDSAPRDGLLRVVDFELTGLNLGAVSLIVNTTPLGMIPRAELCPWPAGRPFPPQASVYDLVYNPRDTELVRRARQAGLRAVTGIGMLVEQAALAFELWTGGTAPRQAMFAAAIEKAYETW
jgi:shikimate dehydrogenase